jgi:uncharacterized integral membrane protein
VAENDTPAKGREKWTDYISPRVIVVVVIAVVALLFVFQNTSTGHFHFLFADIKAPRWLWLLGIFAAGFATGFLIARHRAQVRRPKSD